MVRTLAHYAAFSAGSLAALAGVAMVSVPAALIIGGLALAVGAYLLDTLDRGDQ